VITADEVAEIQGAVRTVRVDEDLVGYALALVEKTRRHEYLSLGVSPRGSVALYRAAQALALVEGRGYTVPDDFKRLALPVLAHRTVVSSRYVSTLKQAEQAEAVLREIVESTPVPI
jgi:MoxR-like ATPase